jgi:hypothetical protein
VRLISVGPCHMSKRLVVALCCAWWLKWPGLILAATLIFAGREFAGALGENFGNFRRARWAGVRVAEPKVAGYC